MTRYVAHGWAQATARVRPANPDWTQEQAIAAWEAAGPDNHVLGVDNDTGDLIVMAQANLNMAVLADPDQDLDGLANQLEADGRIVLGVDPDYKHGPAVIVIATPQEEAAWPRPSA